MAAPWNDGDPKSYPYSDGNGPDEGGTLWGVFKGIAGAVGKGASAGMGLGDASSGMAGGPAVETPPLLDKLYQGATDLGQLAEYPGYGDLWTYDLRDGVEVTQQGWVILGAAGVVLYFVLFAGGR